MKHKERGEGKEVGETKTITNQTMIEDIVCGDKEFLWCCEKKRRRGA